MVNYVEHSVYFLRDCKHKTHSIPLGRSNRMFRFHSNEISVKDLFLKGFPKIPVSHWSTQMEGPIGISALIDKARIY